MILTLTTLRFPLGAFLRTLCYTTYIALHYVHCVTLLTYSILKIQLTFMLLTLFYLHYVQCDNAHIFRGTSFTHKKREPYSQKINSYERQKG